MELEYISLLILKREIGLISAGIKCFCAACIDPQCHSIECTTCNKRTMTTDFTQLDASCPVECTNGQVPTAGKEQSSENCLRIDQEVTIQYASTLRTMLRGYTLTKWTQVNWMSFKDKWASCTDAAKLDHPQVGMEGMVNEVCASTTEA